MTAIIADNGRALAVAALICFVAAAAGGALTQLGPWYQSLAKPSWQPPNWVFPTVWTTVFALIAIAVAVAWNSAEDGETRRWLMLAFLVNIALNIAWSGLFFTLKRPDWALVEVAVFWLSIVALIWVAGRASTLAAVLLLPYLAWVSIASVLNLRIVQLNGPFGG